MTNAPERITVTYTNWKGVTSERNIVPNSIRFDATDWHPEPQWLLRAWDEDRQAWRDFALKDFDFRADLANRQRDEAVGAACAGIIREAVGLADGRDEAAFIERRLMACLPDDATAALERVKREAFQEGYDQAKADETAAIIAAKREALKNAAALIELLAPMLDDEPTLEQQIAGREAFAEWRGKCG